MTKHLLRVNLKSVSHKSGRPIFWMVESTEYSKPEHLSEALNRQMLTVTVLWSRKTDQKGVFKIVERKTEVLTREMVHSIEHQLNHVSYVE